QHLRVAHRRIPNRKPLAVLHPEDFVTLQAEMLPPTPAPVESESKAITIRSISRPTLELVALLRSVTHAAPSLPLFLDLKAASAYAGLPQSYLQELIDQKKLRAVKRPRWTRVSRLALDELAQ